MTQGTAAVVPAPGSEGSVRGERRLGRHRAALRAAHGLLDDSISVETPEVLNGKPSPGVPDASMGAGGIARTHTYPARPSISGIQ